MRGLKAKRIRKNIYGDFSHRVRKYTKDSNGAIINIGKRKEYLDAKKDKK